MAHTIAYNIRAIDQFTATAAKIAASATSIDKTMRKMAKGTGVASRSFTKLRDTSVSASGATMHMKDSSKAAERQLERVAHATKKVTRANRSAARSSKDVSKAVKDQNRAFQKQLALQKSIGRGLDNTGRLITTRVVMPMALAGAGAIKMTMDFNKGLANVGTLIPGQTERLQKFKQEVLALSVETGTGANIMTDGLYQVISAIGDTSETMDILKLSSRAAIAGVAETKDSVNLLTKVSSAYNDTSAGMIQKVSDLSFLAVKLGVTTFPELANSMGKISATAGTMGVSVEELFADTAALTKVMGDTSQAATAMDSVLRGLLQGNTDLDAAMKKMGAKSGKDLIERFGGLRQALGALKESVKGDEVAFAKLFGRAEAQKGALLLTGSLAKAAADNMTAMKNAVGATDAAYKAQTEGIAKTKHKWEQAKARFFKMAVTVGEKLLPAFSRLLDRVQPIINYISKLDDKTISAAIAFASFALKVAIVSSAIGKLMSISSGIQGMMASMTSDVAGFGNAANTAAGKAGRLTNKISGLQKGIAVIGAAAMGYSIGQLIQEAAIAPAVKKSEKESLDVGNLSVQIERRMEDMSLRQLKESRKLLEAKQEKLGVWDFVVNNEEFKRVTADSAKALGKLDAKIKIAERMNRENAAVFAGGIKGELEGLGKGRGGMGGVMMPQENRKVELEITTKSEAGSEIKAVKVKSKNAYANMKTGKNVIQ